MFDVTQDMTLVTLYTYLATFVGNVNTLAISPVVSTPADAAVLSRIYDWNALLASLLKMLQIMRNSQSDTSIHNVLSHAYRPVICGYTQGVDALTVLVGVFKP